MLSTVLILPAAQVATGNAVAEAMGWGPSNYSVPLSADGNEPGTHFGLHAWASEGFRQMIETRFYPPELGGVVTEAAFEAMLAALVSSFREDMVGHWQDVLTTQGLEVLSND